MAIRANHYEAAFEEYLRQRRIPYVAVDEQRRTLLEQASLKSMDFIVYSRNPVNLLVDIKGRRFPTVVGGHKWENWTGAEDVPALLQWQEVFGTGFRAVVVFAYDLLEERHHADFPDRFEFRGRSYAFFGAWADDYQAAMNTRSASWKTVFVSGDKFEKMRFPMQSVLPLSPTANTVATIPTAPEENLRVRTA